MKEIEETILEEFATMLLMEVDEEPTEASTASASAIETFAFELAKIVSQVLT